jgi:hypothetical protein
MFSVVKLSLVPENCRYLPHEPRHRTETHTVISDNYFCRLATTRFAGPSAMRTACATVRG